MTTAQLEANKAAVRAYLTAMNNDDLSTLRTVTSAEMFAKVQAALQEMHAMFSEHSLHIQELIAEDEQVVARVLSNGRHTGDFLGVPVTGRTWEGNEGVGIFRFADGVIVDIWTIFNIPLHLQKLGIRMNLSVE
jgi:predicted ester cyclase